MAVAAAGCAWRRPAQQREGGMETVPGRAAACRLRACAGGGGGVVEEEDEVFLGFSKDRLLSEVSTWGIGGPASYFAEVTDEVRLAACLRYCQRHNLRYFVLGKGSNCLFDDRGFDGLVLLNRIDFVQSSGAGVYRAGSGHAFNLLGMRCSKEGFSGLEFACGIPGTVGGAVYMNAGADGQQTSDVLTAVEVVTGDGEVRVLSKEKGQLQYGYRSSPFQQMQGFCAITAATFQLAVSVSARDRQRSYLDRRKRTQPVTERTAGCVFRNPGVGGLSAGALIDQAGLKGVRVGEAAVSEVHANFLVNLGNSKAADMMSLISLVKDRVRKTSGVDLQEEIIYVPYTLV